MLKKSASAVLLVILILYVITSFREKAISNPEKNDFDYNFKVKDLNGNLVDFNMYRDKVVFINLWATWCGPCRSEMPGIQSLYKKIQSDDIVFVMLSVDSPDDHKKVRAYVDRNGYSFPVFMPDKSLPDQLNVKAIPTTFIIDRNGKINKVQTGADNYDTEKYAQLLTSLSQRQ